MRISAEAERAALLAKAEFFKKKHALEEELRQLDKERDEFRKKKEMLDIEGEIDANTAKIEYLK